MPKANQRTHFQSKSAYVEWRSHWRRRYHELSDQIALCKRKIRMGYNPRKIQGILASMRHEAHTMMIAREAVEKTYREMKLAA